MPGVSGAAIDNDNGIGFSIHWMLSVGPDRDGGTAGSWYTTSGIVATDNQVNFFDSTDNEFFLTGVQLEVGSVATPFEHRSYGDELLRCQRYYQKIPVRTYSWCGYCFSTTDARAGIPLITPMRSTGQTIEVTDTPRFSTSNGSGTGTVVLSGTALESISVQSTGATGLAGSGFVSAMRSSGGTLAYIRVESEL